MEAACTRPRRPLLLLPECGVDPEARPRPPAPARESPPRAHPPHHNVRVPTTTTEKATPPRSHTTVEGLRSRLPAMSPACRNNGAPRLRGAQLRGPLGLLVDKELTERRTGAAASLEGGQAAHARCGRGHRLPPPALDRSQIMSRPRPTGGGPPRPVIVARPAWQDLPGLCPGPLAIRRATPPSTCAPPCSTTCHRPGRRRSPVMAAWSRRVLSSTTCCSAPQPEQAVTSSRSSRTAHQRSTIVTSQLPVSLWHEALGTRPSPMPSWTACWSSPTASSSPESPCAESRRRPQTTRRSRDHRPHHGPHGQRQPQWEPVTLRRQPSSDSRSRPHRSSPKE